ncbi:MAG TPA: hypothetical protein VD866_23920 [Urbifossiella sp.]|nr:hypothetical protein [Urbifossiella sp.]
MSGKKQVRAAFRAAVFRRDRYRCVTCGEPGRDRQGGDGHPAFHDEPDERLVPLDAHHITDRNEMPNGGYVPENGITLCDDGCHRLAEVFHQTGTPHPGFAPADLYARIGSSHDVAVRAAEAG